MLPKILHQVWVGPNELPDKFRHLQEKLIQLHPAWEYKLWTDDNVEDICQKNQYDHYSYAGQSNLIRLYALKKFGGIYLDLDFDVLKPFDNLVKYNDFVAKQPDGVYCNAIMGATAESPWINDMINNYGNPNDKDAAWGCHIIKNHLSEDVNILPTDYFYPYNWDAKPLPPTENTYAIHLWEGSWLNK